MPGYIDRVDQAIHGWFWDETRRAARPRVVCRVDGEWAGAALAGEFRADLAEAGFGDGHGGFRLPLPESCLDGREHRLELRVAERPEFRFPGVPAELVLGTPSFTVAALDAGDAETYADFWAAHLEAETGVVGNRSAIARSAASFIRQGDGLLLGGWSGGRVVGFCALERKPGDPYRHGAVLRIAVLRLYRSKGLGGRLLSAALVHAGPLGLRRVELTVNVGNTGARRLYERFGFVAEGVLRDNYRDAGGYADEVLMARLLA